MYQITYMHLHLVSMKMHLHEDHIAVIPLDIRSGEGDAMSARAAGLSDEAMTIWARLVRVSQALLADVEADLKGAGFPPLAQYDALLELRRAGKSGLRPFELQREMLLAQYNLSRLVDRLKRAGYVERRPSDKDGRGHTLHITSAGRDLLRRMWPAYAEAIRARFADRLNDEELADLARALAKLKDAKG